MKTPAKITAAEYATMEQKLAQLAKEQEMLSSAFNGLSAEQIVEMSVSVREQIDELMASIFDDLLVERETWKSAFPDLALAEVIELAQLGQMVRDAAAKSPAVTSPTGKTNLTVVTHSDSAEATDRDLLARLGGKLKGTGYKGSDPTPAMVRTLEKQLSGLYSEWEILNHHFPGQNAAQIVDKISGQVARLEALYRATA